MLSPKWRRKSWRHFCAKGGKLILTHGTTDGLIPLQNTVDCYQRQVQKFGQATVDGFMRFYMIPGFDHGAGRYNLGYDGLAVLDWRVRGARPHPWKQVSPTVFGDACEGLNSIISIA